MTRRLRPLALLLLSACGRSSAAAPPEPSPSAPAASAPPPAASAPAPPGPDPACAAEWEGLRARPIGDPALDRARVQLLGRARGEPVWFVRAPAAPPADPRGRPSRLLARGGLPKAALRERVLREGYLLHEDPTEAAALAVLATLPRLFDEPSLELQRGHETRRLERRDKPARYVYADGPDAGDEATLLFGDRVAPGALGAPLHRDVAALADAVGFDRARIRGGTDAALALEVRVEGAWRRLVARAKGAELAPGCWVEPGAEAAAARARGGLRHRALAKVRAAVDALSREGLRFDRPHGVKTADRDGELRPAWWRAYQRGGRSFSVDGEGYPVFDAAGRPHPPEVCVDFVLDAFERAGGTWFQPEGKAPARVVGTLDWEPAGGRGLRGVHALFDWASKRPELFEAARLPDARRVPFGQRGRFLGGLADDDARAADPSLAGPTERFDVEAGDVVAIHGEKSDGLVHQHAILVERVDVLTGLPSGLADQMRKPRRRSWEGIMAEAPKRSLFYRIRPKEAVWRRVLGE